MSKVALVTGASRGIGRSIAEALAAAGYAVVVNFVSRREEADATVAAISAHGGTAFAVPADVSDPGAVARMFAAIDDRFGRLDALVNNAGIGRRFDRLTDIDDATWRQTLAVNLDGAFFCLRAAVPRLQAAGGGRIGNSSSGAARTGGLLALTAKAARELARDGISVNAVLPSVIETEMLDAVAPDAASRSRVMAPVSHRPLRAAGGSCAGGAFPGGGGARLPDGRGHQPARRSPLTGHDGARLAMSVGMG